MFRRLVALAALVAASPVGAQDISDISARLAPQFHSYKIDSPTNTTISEFAVPLYVLVPISSRLSFDIGSSFTQAKVEQTGTTTVTSTISGPTDTQIRGNLVLGNDFVVLTAGVNLPTGKSTVSETQRVAAGLIGSDFLAFPITNIGTGFGGTGGIAMALPLSEDWNLGFGVSVRHSSQYDPFDAAGAQVLHYQPGNEYRGRVGLDHPVGTGQFSVGLTYSTFGDDNLGGSIYNTGNRYFAQLDYNNSLGPGRVSVTGWNLFRTRGTLADSSTIDTEDVAVGTLAYGIPMGSAVLEPNVEGRTWNQPGLPRSYLSTFGLRLQFNMGGMVVVPSGGYSYGQLAAQTGAFGSQNATLTGFHGTLAIRIQ